MSVNRTSEKTTASAETDRLTPSLVRMSPWTIHGWRPTSAVIQPAWFATWGPSTATTSSFSSHRGGNEARRAA